ncbi:MAG: hypothetical protein IJI14_07590 [Anaerolineaceae bacterium]|nr:hypothetical protein [Anaerolineaceae bacterium]
MSEKSMYVNNFSLTAQDMVCVLEAKSLAPNIERVGNGETAMFGTSRIIDEDFLYLTPQLTKELAFAILRVLSEQENKTGVRFLLQPEKQALWEDLVSVLNEHS